MRGRTLRTAPFALAWLVMVPALSGCVITDTLFGAENSVGFDVDPFEQVNSTGSGSGQTVNFTTSIIWKVGYTWTWVTDDGSTITDIVSDDARTNRSHFYRVDSYDRYAPELQPVKKLHLYNANNLGLVRSQDERGYIQYSPYNVPLEQTDGFRAIDMSYRLTGKTPVPAVRTGIIYDLGLKTVSVPAGSFEAREVKIFVNETQNGKRFPHEFTHWFSPAVKNDVAFERAGQLYRLKSFSLEPNPSPQPPKPAVVDADHASWKVGYAWTWSRNNHTEQFSQTVLSEHMLRGEKFFKVRETWNTPSRNYKLTQTVWYRADNLARVNLTQGTNVNQWFIPHDSPRLPDPGTYEYEEHAKYYRTVWIIDYRKETTVAGVENVTTYAGNYRTYRYEVSTTATSRSDGQVATANETMWWSPAVANYAAWGNSGGRWDLQQFRLGEIRKWDRDW